jgi:dihydrofolate synthase / folylpolyglutamate synthase
MTDRERADGVYAALLERMGEQWVQPRVERTRRVLDLLGEPQRAYRVVHVTGTNGKTSTSRMIESIVRAHGLRTGLFTSPHLVRFTERIVIDGEPIDDALIADAWEEIEPIIALVDAELAATGDAALTYFELLTVLAFVAFADAPVDVAVIEVGMGGSWDSTNTADGDVAVIGPIAMDHADRLGHTITEIARVKSGIIKPGARVVSAEQTADAAAVLRARADEVGATLYVEPEQFALTDDRVAVGGQVISVRGIAGTYDSVPLPLHGAHQAHNAALAIAAVEALIGEGEQPIVEALLVEGLAQVLSPGRMQLIGTLPTVVVDAAHNPHGAHALAAALPQAFDAGEWGLIVGVLGDKDAAGILRELAGVAKRVFVTAPDSDRASDPEQLADVAEDLGLSVSVHPDLEDAAATARAWAQSDDDEGPRRGILIAGSVVLAGEAIALARADGWLVPLDATGGADA